MLLFSLLINSIGTINAGPQIPVYKYSFQQSYTFPEKIETYRLGQIYFVSPYTFRDFRNDNTSKKRTDKQVEEALLQHLE
jgi:hypothetical protein